MFGSSYKKLQVEPIFLDTFSLTAVISLKKFEISPLVFPALSFNNFDDLQSILVGCLDPKNNAFQRFEVVGQDTLIFLIEFT